MTQAQQSVVLDLGGDSLELMEGTLLFFIDETGHEAFTDPRHRVFGLGGCGVPVPHYASNVAGPWLNLKATHFQDETVLHASAMRLSRDQMRRVGDFFKQNFFARIAVTCGVNTAMAWEGKEEAFELCAKLLLKRIVDVAETFNRLSGIAMICEHSERANAMYNRYLTLPDDLVLTGPTGESHQIEVFHGCAGKGIVEGLEVADFIMHAAGGTARQIDAGKRPSQARSDFNCVFEPQSIVKSFFHVTRGDVPMPDGAS